MWPFHEENPLHKIWRRRRLVFLVGALFALLSVFASLFLPLQYRAEAQVFIISKARYGVDPYTVIKSAERVGDNLSQIVGTNDFFEKVMRQPGYSFDQSRFKDVDEKIKRKRWQQSVETSVVYGTGLLSVKAYGDTIRDAEQLAGAVAATLISQGWEYAGNEISIKMVNEPVANKWPARPNFPINAALGFLAGLMLSAVVVIMKKS